MKKCAMEAHLQQLPITVVVCHGRPQHAFIVVVVQLHVADVLRMTGGGCALGSDNVVPLWNNTPLGGGKQGDHRALFRVQRSQV